MIGNSSIVPKRARNTQNLSKLSGMGPLFPQKMKTIKNKVARRFARRCSTLLDVFARRCSTLLDVARRLLDVFALKKSRFLIFQNFRPKISTNWQKTSKLAKHAPKLVCFVFWSVLAVEWPQLVILSDPYQLLRLLWWRSSISPKLIGFFYSIPSFLHMFTLNFSISTPSYSISATFSRCLAKLQ